MATAMSDTTPSSSDREVAPVSDRETGITNQRGPATSQTPIPESARGSSAGAAFARLVDIMRVLRSPGGCPWDREQTVASLAPFVLEEAHEVIDAIEREDWQTLRGEIGDLIFEGVFLAQVCDERGDFSVADSLGHVIDKLVRRHPHVFPPANAGGTPSRVSSPEKVVEQWEQIKAGERAAANASHVGTLDGIPRSLPALLAAYEIGSRVAAVGFDWEASADVLLKVEEEVAELRSAVTGESSHRAAEEMGDLLFALANLSRKLGIEPEAALRAANRKFTSRFRTLEQEVERSGLRPQDLTLDELEAIWQRVKREEASDTAP
jgi:MazG family protein